MASGKRCAFYWSILAMRLVHNGGGSVALSQDFLFFFLHFFCHFATCRTHGEIQSPLQAAFDNKSGQCSTVCTPQIAGSRVNKGEAALHLSGRGIYKALDDCRNLTPCVRQIRKYGVALPINVSSSNTYSCTFIPDKEIQCNTTY